MNKITEEALAFFSKFDNRSDKLFCKFLKAPREIQERVFLKVRSKWGNDTPEMLEKYQCWRSVDQMISMLHEAAVEKCMSSGGHWTMLDLGVTSEEELAHAT